MNKPGAPKKNKNAMRGEQPAHSSIQFRCTPAQKAGFIQAAQAEGLKLSEWIINKLSICVDK
jgi:uncharacterized protein (DUF1778 family)